MWLARQGFTLIEVMVASLIGSVVAGGIFAAYVAAGRMMGGSNSAAYVEAASFAQQTLERLRNEVAMDTTWFGDNASSGWQVDPDPLPPSGGTLSILNPPGAVRMFCVRPLGCAGGLSERDCYMVRVKVCWNGTPCPAVGAACW